MSIMNLSELVNFAATAAATATNETARATFEGQRQAFAFMLQAEQETNRRAAELAAQSIPTRNRAKVERIPV